MFDPVGSTKGGRQFPVSGSLEKKRETPPDKPFASERDPTHSEVRKTNFQQITGQKKTHSNVLKVFFSADCESDGIRIGL